MSYRRTLMQDGLYPVDDGQGPVEEGAEEEGADVDEARACRIGESFIDYVMQDNELRPVVLEALKLTETEVTAASCLLFDIAAAFSKGGRAIAPEE